MNGFFTEFEANFLKLIDMLTDGSRIEVNESGTHVCVLHVYIHVCACVIYNVYMYVCLYTHALGTILYYKPGILIGGNITHDCNMSRSIGYYLEPIIMLAPFMTKPISVTMKGITNGPTDPSVCVCKMIL